MERIHAVKNLEVRLHGRPVGTLAELEDGRVAFQYDANWLKDGFSISPISLPLKPDVFIPKASNPFEGLFGIFYDSLPDGWGRLLVDRRLQTMGINPHTLSSLERLSIVGNSGRGALEYIPSQALKASFQMADLDELAAEADKILQNQTSQDLDLLYALGGSSGGARPKVMLDYDGGTWIIKFPSSFDTPEIGAMEYAYFQTAEKCGLEVPPYRLFESKHTSGYFGSQRFDREKTGEKIHMASASALLEVSHRIPSLDYIQLLRLTWILTNKVEEVWKLYRWMCFNVFAHNRDDHSNNFSFLYQNGKWKVSPVYDLTWSQSLNGEHATMINGNGSNPGVEDLVQAGAAANLPQAQARKIAVEIRETVQRNLSRYLQLSRF